MLLVNIYIKCAALHCKKQSNKYYDVSITLFVVTVVHVLRGSLYARMYLPDQQQHAYYHVRHVGVHSQQRRRWHSEWTRHDKNTLEGYSTFEPISTNRGDPFRVPESSYYLCCKFVCLIAHICLLEIAKVIKDCIQYYKSVTRNGKTIYIIQVCI